MEKLDINAIDDEGLIRFWHESGVDMAYGDGPINHMLAEIKQTPEQAKHTSQSSPHSAPLQPISSTEQEAQPDLADITALAQSAKTLKELRTTLDIFEGCALKTTATQLVFSDGNPDAKIMLIGEAPGRDDDLQGVPFAGKSGQLLDLMLASIGLDRDQVYLTHIVPWRPPANRAPSAEEVAMCMPFLERHIQLVNPEILVLVGGFSAKTLLECSEGIMRLRGKWHTFDLGQDEKGMGQTIPALCMLHPEYLLRNPSHKRLAWEDLLVLKAQLE